MSATAVMFTIKTNYAKNKKKKNKSWYCCWKYYTEEKEARRKKAKLLNELERNDLHMKHINSNVKEIK